MPFTCVSQPCTSTKLEAKGMCRFHYKQTRPRTPDKPKLRTCTGCGAQTARLSSSKYTKTYCSELCRHWVQWGAWSVAVRKPRVIAAPKPAPTVRAFECDWCGKTAGTTLTSMRYCSRSCLKRAGATRRRAREFNAVGTYTWAQVVKLWLSFDKRCAYCLTTTALEDIQAEHVEALSCGGANNLSNLLPSCAACNSDKRQLTLAAWAVDRERRGLVPVVTAWRDDDTRYAHLASGTSLRMSA